VARPLARSSDSLVMLTPLALFLGLLAATAFIAHWSDNLGKKLGKKRVSVFGLRPRTSATILTVVSSWGIMALTLVALLLAVAPLRIALFSYEQQLTSFKEKIRDSQQSLQQVEFQRTTAQAQAQGSQNAAEKSQSQATRFRSDATKARGDAAKAQQDAAKAKADLDRATAALNRAQSAEQTAKSGESSARNATNAAQKQEQRARAAFASANSQLIGTQTNLSQTQNRLRQIKSNLAKKKLEVAKVQGRLANSQQRLSASQQKLSTSQKRLDALGQRLIKASKRVIDSYKQVANSYKEVAQAKKEVATEQKRATNLQAISEKLQTDVDSLQAQFNKNLELTTGLAFNEIQLHFDQTLAERHIDANPLSDQVKSELRLLITSAQEAARVLVPDAEVAVEPIYIADPKIGERVALSEEQTLDSYARLLAASNQGVSARLVSASNYPEGQKRVLARFVFVPIRTIYGAGQSIGESTIDATKSEAAIFGQLQDLVEEARQNAEKNGSRPPLSPEDRNFFDGDTGQKMFDTLRQLQRLGHPVPVRVVAARDLDATEPLQIRFQIGPSKSGKTGGASNTT